MLFNNQLNVKQISDFRQSFRSIVKEVVKQQKGPRVSQSGCEVPFVPVSGSSGFSRYKQLSTRRPGGGRPEPVNLRASSQSELMGRRLAKTKAFRESSTPNVYEPSMTVAVHKFKGGKDESSRAAVLQTQSTLYSPSSPGGKNVAVLSTSGLQQLPEIGSELPAYAETSNITEPESPPRFDFSNINEPDTYQERQKDSHESHETYPVPGEKGRWKALKDNNRGDSDQSLSTSRTPIISVSGANGYHSSKEVDMSQIPTVQPSTLPPRKGMSNRGVSEKSDIDRTYGMSSNGHNGDHRYSGDRWSPGQGRPWLMVEEMKEPDHPGRRKSSGFFQPIKHLSGKKNLKEEGDVWPKTITSHSHMFNI